MDKTADNSIYMRMMLCEKIKLEPAFISRQYRDEIMKRLKAKVEGMCSRHGYIKPDSIEIYKICVGRVEMISLNGNTLYDVHFHAEVCNPLLGSVIKCRVANINKFGILAEADNIIEAIIAKNSVNIQSDIDLDKVRIGDEVLIEVLGKKYELNDKRISLIGRIVRDSTLKAVPTVSMPTAPGKRINLDNEEDEDEPEDIPVLEGGADDDSDADSQSEANAEDEEELSELDGGSEVGSESDKVGNFFSDDEDYFNSDFEDGGDDDNDDDDDGEESDNDE
jgi:DNA-directed RNA polymerase subunit E'/Rpb7